MAPLCAGPAYAILLIAITASVLNTCTAQRLQALAGERGSSTNATSRPTIAAMTVTQGQNKDCEPELIMRWLLCHDDKQTAQAHVAISWQGRQRARTPTEQTPATLAWLAAATRSIHDLQACSKAITLLAISLQCCDLSWQKHGRNRMSPSY